MPIALHRMKLRLLLLIIGLSLIGPSFALRSVHAFEAVEVEVVIRNSTYEFHGGILKPNQPAVIHLRNMDDITHGFMSDIFDNIDVEIETSGGTIYGKAMKGVHIYPQEEIEMRFTPLVPGQYKFHCDLHPKMKGELLVMSVGTV